MPLLKLAAPAVAFAVGTYAAQCSTSATLTLTNAADASGLASCETYSGSIAIATGATELSIPVTRVTENLVTVPQGLISSLSAPSLTQVDGELSILSQANLATLSMPSLTEVNMLTLQALGPNLLQVDFGTPGLQQVTNLSVQDTYLSSLAGMTSLKTAAGVNIATNSMLKELSMVISNVTGTLSIRGNSRGLVVSLPNLAEAGIVQINDCSSVSVPALGNVTQTVAFVDNLFTGLALPNLTQIGPGAGGLTVASNPSLTNLSVPLLAKVQGGVDVVNNTKLTGTYSFPSLRLVGSAEMEGPFTDVTMPKLAQMQGTLTLASNKNINSVCSRYKALGVIGGNVNCRTVSTTTASTASATSKPNAAGHYTASPETVFSILGGLAAFFDLLM